MNVLLGFLSNLLFVIALIFLVTFLLALLNVKAVLRNHPRKRAAIATFFLFLIFAALAGATEPQQKEQPRTVVVAKAVTPTSQPTQTHQDHSRCSDDCSTHSSSCLVAQHRSGIRGHKQHHVHGTARNRVRTVCRTGQRRSPTRAN